LKRHSDIQDGAGADTDWDVILRDGVMVLAEENHNCCGRQ